MNIQRQAGSRDDRVGSEIQACLTPKPLFFLKISYCLQKEETPNGLPTWCHFLSGCYYRYILMLLEGNRVRTKMLRMSMEIQFRGAFGRTLGSN